MQIRAYAKGMWRDGPHSSRGGRNGVEITEWKGPKRVKWESKA